jgi:aryl-alcohol dehydrogenase-like predicted oxidoreductase
MASTMRTRKLGNSGIEVGEIGLGTWGLSGDGYGPVEPAVARATLEAALEAGSTFVETAACYGREGATERLIGQVLRERGREAAFVATRIGVDREAAGGPRKRFDKAGLLALAEGSLRRLDTEYVDAFLLHNPLPETVRVPEVFEALRGLRDQGKARLVGVSVGSIAVARAALRHPIDLIELPYNLLYPKLLHTLAADLASAGVGVIVRSPLAYGLLAGTWAADRHFGDGDHRAERWSPAELARRIRQREAARFLVKGEVHSLREAAIRYVLSNHLVSVAVVGARTPEQARENAHAADTLPYLETSVLANIGARMNDEGVEY